MDAEAAATGTWASSIPLVSLLFAVFSAGVVVTQVRSMKEMLRELKKDLVDKIEKVEDDGVKHTSEVRRNLVEKISELKGDFERSSEDQGKRIGNLEAEQRAEQRASQVRDELTGRHSAVPREVR